MERELALLFEKLWRCQKLKIVQLSVFYNTLCVMASRRISKFDNWTAHMHIFKSMGIILHGIPCNTCSKISVDFVKLSNHPFLNPFKM